MEVTAGERGPGMLQRRLRQLVKWAMLTAGTPVSGLLTGMLFVILKTESCPYRSQAPRAPRYPGLLPAGAVWEEFPGTKLQ